MPASKKQTSNEKVTIYESLVAALPNVERKGAANPYTSINGNMFTLLHQSQTLAIRLPEDKRQEFIRKYKASLFEAYGTVMKEYVQVPDILLNNSKELGKYMLASYEYAKSLRAKATTKKKH
jgi:TfoX/Sxy family transcriptional regulator of competence genes